MFIKAAWHVREPLTWKGGLLIPLFKGKGSPSDPQAYRSIFPSDICAEVHHARVRASLADEWNSQNNLIQMGGKKGCSTDVAHHFMHAHLAWAKSTNSSCAMMFVDLQAAFYSILRSSLFEGDFHDDVLCFAMQRLGILPEEWSLIRETVVCDKAIGRIDPHIEGILKDMFSGTHFTMQGLDDCTATFRGTRPGDPVADILFNMAFRLLVLDTRDKIRAASDIEWFGDPSLSQVQVIPAHGFAEVSFVDDIAYAVHAPSAELLVTSLQLVASCLHDSACSRGLTLNYQAGKTEAIVKLAGPGSRSVQQKVWHDLGGKLPVVSETSTQWLRLVHSYKHLGSFLQDHGVVSKDVRYRNAQARKAFGQLQRSFYSKRNVDSKTKAAVFNSLVVSRHAYNACTWAIASQGEIDLWSNGLRSQIASLARSLIRPIPAFSFSTDELYAIVGIDAPQDLLHANRLRYARRAVFSAPGVLWTFLLENSAEGSWIKMLGDSVAWLCAHFPGKIEVDASDPVECLRFVSLNQKLSGHVRSALASCLRFRQEQAKGKLWTLRVKNRIEKYSAVVPNPLASPPKQWQCSLCDQSFDSKQALAVHARHKHQYRRMLKYYVLGSQDAAIMQQRWIVRTPVPGQAFSGLDGYSVQATSEMHSDVDIIPFVMHTTGDNDEGGPSCETWSAARHCPPGPGPVRSNACPWGITGLNRKQWQQVAVGTILIKFLVDLLLEAAVLGLSGFFEHPQFPVWLMKVSPASVWALQVMSMLSKLACFQVCSFDQCIYGLSAKKPTTLLLLRLSTFKDLTMLKGDCGRCNHHTAHRPLQGIQADGQFHTARAKIYPRAMNHAIALAVSRFLTDLQGNDACDQLPEDMREFESHQFVSDDIVQPDYHWR
eukprot:s462_g61.t1